MFRGQKVTLDSDLAELYGVPTGRLNEQVRRNIRRLPADFMYHMYQLTIQDAETLRSQSAISKSGRGGRRGAPLVFSEQGVGMLSSVLNSERATQVNIEIMRAFVRLRAMAFSYKELARKVDALERKYDSQFMVVFDAIRKLMETPSRTPKPRVGFRVGD